MKKLAAVSMSALMIALLVGLVATPASAQPYPPKKPTCQVSDTSISPGDQVTVSGKHWQPGSTVTFTLQPEGINLGSTTVGRNGKFSTVVTIPNNVQPGPHTIVCSGINRRGDPVVRAITVQILGLFLGGVGGPASTGTVLNVPLWMVLIAALFVAGVGVVAIGRRRRRSVGTSPSGRLDSGGRR
jgi:hypothetical protein